MEDEDETEWRQDDYLCKNVSVNAVMAVGHGRHIVAGGMLNIPAGQQVAPQVLGRLVGRSQRKRLAASEQVLSPLKTATRSVGTKPCSLLSFSVSSLICVHADQSAVSVTLALNDEGEYEGGGTTFAVPVGKTVRPGRGHVVAFKGGLQHGGSPVTRGVRYIVAAFLFAE